MKDTNVVHTHLNLERLFCNEAQKPQPPVYTRTGTAHPTRIQNMCSRVGRKYPEITENIASNQATTHTEHDQG